MSNNPGMLASLALTSNMKKRIFDYSFTIRNPSICKKNGYGCLLVSTVYWKGKHSQRLLGSTKNVVEVMRSY